jgi:Raf kinase inhibitor-like YbhB/YbcL family protein
MPLELACKAPPIFGQNRSPQLSWSNVPSSTTRFAIIMDDEDSPCGVGDNACIHWGLFNLSSTGLTSLPNSVDLSGNTDVTFGVTYDRATAGYNGPCPPSAHRYKTTIYALGQQMPVIPNRVTGLTRSKFESTYFSHILGKATLTGRFAPP